MDIWPLFMSAVSHRNHLIPATPKLFHWIIQADFSSEAFESFCHFSLHLTGVHYIKSQFVTQVQVRIPLSPVSCTGLSAVWSEAVSLWYDVWYTFSPSGVLVCFFSVGEQVWQVEEVWGGQVTICEDHQRRLSWAVLRDHHTLIFCPHKVWFLCLYCSSLLSGYLWAGGCQGSWSEAYRLSSSRFPSCLQTHCRCPVFGPQRCRSPSPSQMTDHLLRLEHY